MKIGIDARFFGSIGKGLGRYTQKLVEYLEQIDRENQYVVFLRQENFDEYIPKNPNFKKVLADYRWYSFSEQFNMPLLLRKYNLDLVHFPHFNVPLFYRKPFIITVHDLILLHFPTVRATTHNKIFYWLKFLAYRLTISRALKKANHVVTVSEFTKNDILSCYKISKNKISVTYEACENSCLAFRKNDGQILDKYGIMNQYFLYVGNAYPHKNLENLLLAFAAYQKENKEAQLVLVGKEDYFYARLKRFVDDKKIPNVVFPGFVPDEDLGVVYKNALAYVFPSLYEGFGLPPLEAMSYGAPVISSDHACMKEILGSASLFVDASKEDEITKAMKTISGNQELRNDLIQKGYNRIGCYDWKKMAENTLNIYQKTKTK